MLLSNAQAVFPGFTVFQLMNEVGEALLYQAETIRANEMGFERVESVQTGSSDGFRARWEAATGRRWND